jgi:pSer/pThr/pTyr-binding forkhead associated (FHA) protein
VSVVVVIVVESPKAAAPLELTFKPDEEISIGRDAKSHVQLPEASVSLRHARLAPDAGGYVLVDENSTNGTFLNAVRVLPGTAKPVADGDRVQVGRALLRVQFRSPSLAPPVGFSTQDIALALVQGALIQSGSAIIPRLSVVSGPDRGRALVLREERGYVLGRDDDVDLKLRDEDVSRRHTSIVRRGSRLWVIDLGSKNGTRLDSRPLRANVAEAWPDTALLELGQTQLMIEDPVSSALRSLERAPDERLGSDWPRSVAAAAPDEPVPTAVVTLPIEQRARLGLSTDARAAFATAGESKGVLSLSTSSSSSAPSAPIEVLQFDEPGPRPPKRRLSWSTIDALVVGVAVVTIALSALALAWFLAS